MLEPYLMPDGTLMAPKRANEGTLLGDGFVPVKPGSEEYVNWMRWFEQQGKRPLVQGDSRNKK